MNDQLMVRVNVEVKVYFQDQIGKRYTLGIKNDIIPNLQYV